MSILSILSSDFITGLFDKGEWKILVLTMLLAFAITYIVKLFYNILILNREKYKLHIRLIALISGFVSAYMIWPTEILSMQWYEAGILIGPGSILIHHLARGVADSEFFKINLPWLASLLRAWK